MHRRLNSLSLTSSFLGDTVHRTGNQSGLDANEPTPLRTVDVKMEIGSALSVRSVRRSADPTHQHDYRFPVGVVVFFLPCLYLLHTPTAKLHRIPYLREAPAPVQGLQVGYCCVTVGLIYSNHAPSEHADIQTRARPRYRDTVGDRTLPMVVLLRLLSCFRRSRNGRRNRWRK